MELPVGRDPREGCAEMGEEPRPEGRSVDPLAWRLVRGAGWGETREREEEEEREREGEEEPPTRIGDQNT